MHGDIANSVLDASGHIRHIAQVRSRVHGGMSEVSGHLSHALIQFAVDEDAATDTRAEGEHQHVPVPLSGAKGSFRRQRSVRIIQDKDLRACVR